MTTLTRITVVVTRCYVDFPEDFCNQKVRSQDRQSLFKFYVFDCDYNYYKLYEVEECYLEKLCFKSKTDCKKDCNTARFDIIIEIAKDILYAKSYIYVEYVEALSVYKKTTDITKKRIFIGEKIYIENYLIDSEIQKKC